MRCTTEGLCFLGQKKTTMVCLSVNHWSPFCSRCWLLGFWEKPCDGVICSQGEAFNCWLGHMFFRSSTLLLCFFSLLPMLRQIISMFTCCRSRIFVWRGRMRSRIDQLCFDHNLCSSLLVAATRVYIFLFCCVSLCSFVSFFLLQWSSKAGASCLYRCLLEPPWWMLDWTYL